METIDSELRLLVAVRRVCRELDGRVPPIGPVDALLDERGQDRRLGIARRLSGSDSGFTLGTREREVTNLGHVETHAAANLEGGCVALLWIDGGQAQWLH